MAAQQHRSSRSTECARTTPDDGGITDETAPTSADEVDVAIEREQLRARVRALERELAASERHRQGLIDQYERLLAAREADATAEPATDDRSRLGRVLAPLR